MSLEEIEDLIAMADAVKERNSEEEPFAVELEGEETVLVCEETSCAVRFSPFDRREPECDSSSELES